MRVAEQLTSKLSDVKTRTSFVGEFIVTVDCGVGELFEKHFAEGVHHVALLVGAGVLGTAVAVQTADIADADGVGVVAYAMGSHLTEGTTGTDSAVAIDDIVVAARTEAALAMPTVYFFDCHVLTLFGGRTVKYDFSYISHFIKGLGVRG